MNGNKSEFVASQSTKQKRFTSYAIMSRLSESNYL
jgi:hypothetical protein